MKSRSLEKHASQQPSTHHLQQHLQQLHTDNHRLETEVAQMESQLEQMAYSNTQVRHAKTSQGTAP
jgi:cell division protein FtsB